MTFSFRGLEATRTIEGDAVRRETRSLVPCRSVSLAVLLVLVSLVAAPSQSHASAATAEADDAPVDSLTAVTDQATDRQRLIDRAVLDNQRRQQPHDPFRPEQLIVA